jgi:epoxyqueuosine reductase QueG
MDKEGPLENKGHISEWLNAQGMDVYGIGDMSLYKRDLIGIAPSIKEVFPYAIVFGLVLVGAIMDTITDGPNLCYLHHYRQLNYRLDMTAYLLSREIEKRGFKAMPFAASQVVDWQNQKAHISHKHIGIISGIGWIGRNNLLVHPQYGARVRYNTVLTAMPLIPDGHLRMGCKDCRRCIDVCPGGAIKEEKALFDHLSCYQALREFRNKRNIGHYICGLCVKACRGEL